MVVRALVLGGTGFVGPAVVDDALRRGWDVTVLNRGTRAAPDGVTVVLADRAGANGVDAVREGGWDVAIDTWAGPPRAVHDAATALADRVDRFVYVSSRAVYRYPMTPGADERWPVVDGRPDDGDVGYPQAKRGAELAALAAFGDRCLLARAGLILGPREDIGRLPWWLQRIARGGSVAAPGPPDAGIQYVDVRDLAAFILDASEDGLSGPYNLVCPTGHATMRDLLDACVDATGGAAELRWLSPDRILDAGVEPWVDLPVWLPPGEKHDSMHRANVDKAVSAGLRCRPVEETVADTWAWLRSLDTPPRQPDRGYIRPVGLDPDVEARLLATGR